MIFVRKTENSSFMLRILQKVTSVLVLGFILLNCPSVLGQNIKDKIQCPGHISAYASLGECGTVVSYTDPFESVQDELNQVQNNRNPETYFEVGESSVFYKGADRENNNYFCIFKVKVLDLEKPLFTEFPSDIIVNSINSEGAQVYWNIPQSTDNCEKVSLISNFTSGDFFPIGTTEVKYWAYDKAGNVTERKFEIHVSSVEEQLSESR